MPFTIPTFDELLNNILTDYRNQQGTVSAESLIRSACLASAVWGAYWHQQEYVEKQIFADTSDPANLEHHGLVFGISKLAGETDTAYLARILYHLQKPPAGGNKYDYVKWAKDASALVAKAWCLPLAQGLGTVDVVLAANSTLTGSEIPSSSFRGGVTTSVSAGKLVDSAATFDTGHPVVAGDIVENTTQQTSTTVTARDSGTQLSLADDIFKFSNDNYIIHVQGGNNTSVSQGKLVDSAAAFDDATYTVKKGDIAENVQDGTSATISAVDSAIQLSLDSDIFTAFPRKYVVRSLCGQVKKYIDTIRPVTGSRTRVLAPTILTQNIVMTTTGNCNYAQTQSDINIYLSAFEPGQALYLTQLTSLAVQNGATDAVVTTPSGTVTPTAYQMIRPGTITIT